MTFRHGAHKAREVVHRSFEDPATSEPEEEQLEAFLRVRDEIKGWVVQTFG